MSDPYKLTGPTCLSFSGGRTSAYMLWMVLQSNTAEDIERWLVVCFANTGKEEEATLRFVRECAVRWSVPIVWLEYVSKREPPLYEIVSFERASRAGEPLLRAFGEHNVLPNPVARYCTAETKIRTIRRYLLDVHRWDGDDFDMLLGIRADEPRRVAKLSSSTDARDGVRLAPLARASVTAEMVGEFWRQQEFDLELPNMGGKTMHGNCDLCFLKPAAQVQALIKEKPERAIWWAEVETRLTTNGMPARFRNDRPSYAQMAAFARDQRDMFDEDEEAIACFCGD